MRLTTRCFICTALLFSLVPPLSAQGPKKSLTLADYPRWKLILSFSASPDGNWVSYILQPNNGGFPFATQPNGDWTLFIRNLATDKVYEKPNAQRLIFSQDAQWAAYMVSPPKAEVLKLQREKKQAPKKAEILNLVSGQIFAVENTSSFAFSNDSQFQAILEARQEGEDRNRGSDLILRNAKIGAISNIGNVADFSFNRSGTQLAYLVSAAEKEGNGVYLLDLESGSLKPLDTGKADYARLTWDKEGKSLAVLKGIRKKGLTEKDSVLLVFSDLDKGQFVRIEYDPANDPSFPKGMVISERVQPPAKIPEFEVKPETRSFFFSDDGSRIFVGIKEQQKEPEKSSEPVANVDIWHWKDKRIQSEQMVRAPYDGNFTYRAVYLIPQKKFVRLCDEKVRGISVADNGKWGLGRDNRPYLSDYENMQADYYFVVAATGERKPIAQGIRRTFGISPNSRYFLYLKDKQLWIYDAENHKTFNISQKAPVSFVNEEDDHPGEKPIYGVAGWTADGKSVIVNHKYDLWSLPLDGGSPKNITNGIGDREQIRFRYVKLDPEEKSIDSSRPLLLSAYGEWTKKSGYYSLAPGAAPQKLIYEDKRISTPLKPKNADKLFYTIESFEDFPDYYVSRMDFASPKRLSDANPQQAEYAWGSRVLIDYKNSRGVKLQASLTLPAGYVKGKKYPMIVFIYEKYSGNQNQYSMPIIDDRPHASLYASNGYLFLMPDIVYTLGHPGSSALDAVSAAVNKVIELGYADPERIGLQGHSFGGYESEYILTHSDMFAAIVAGAPPSSDFNQFVRISPGFGFNAQNYHEKGQGRFGTDPWKDQALYISESPLFQADKIKTPFLILHGRADGSVDWIASLEFYNASRFLGKKVILLSYPGEGHHLAKPENQMDFLVRMQQFFDHYLKRTPAPDWMENGVPFAKKKAK